ncbi:MAG: alanine--tRNA ligase [Alphaproteobacteria bacterium]|nr:alanine--tRNA ligase [Alphaproteobacteria bacterium]
MLTTTDIRTQFLEFFAGKGHAILPSSSLVPHNDPTLMFTAAGMVPFKNVFSGIEKISTPRAATAQKCVRAGGKHNDLDNVGYTARHHTFFEMLGNFSFGDYFKEDAIAFAWELITKIYGIPKEKLSVTVYHTDDEAFDLWKKIAGLPEGKILRVPTSDNFWSAGDTGPCGPCTEIFYDHGVGEGEWALNDDGHDMFGERFVEIWNLVFMQYEQKDAQTRINLPHPSIDTGMGLERITAVLQGVHDNYATDLFKTLIAASEAFSKNQQAAHHVSHRVIADHLRATSFLIADGVLPSNEGRGYVLRRIMRRAMRHAHILGCREPLMCQLVPTLVQTMGAAYPELKRAEAVIAETLKLEEEKFKETLDRGLKVLEEEKEKISTTGISGSVLPGAVAFKLYDTYGFPLDLTQDILRGEDMMVDILGFETAMQEQRDRARAAWKGSGQTATASLWFDIRERVGATEFLGYAMDSAQGIITALVKDGAEVPELKKGERGQVIVNQTPFYAESGGQVGDDGILFGKTGGGRVTDTTKPLDGLFAHEVIVDDGVLRINDAVTLDIDVARRDCIRANHSATHLLHAALRRELGEHVTQKGSLVDAERLRFDITHPKQIGRDELAAIELEVNRLIWQNSAITTRLMTQEDAVKAGAMALFGEKYGAEVRVLTMGMDDAGGIYSLELCGGTHAARTGDIGLFKIISESAVAAGVRRIEAVTRDGAYAYTSEQESCVRELAATLKIKPEDIGTKVCALVDEKKKLEKQLAEAKKQLALGGSSGGGAGGDVALETIGSTKLAARIFGELDAKSLRDLANAMQQKHADAVSVLLAGFEGKGSVIVAVGKELSGNIAAPDLVKAAVAALGGQGGGGRPDFAQGGGPDGDKLEAALAAVKAALAA